MTTYIKIYLSTRICSALYFTNQNQRGNVVKTVKHLLRMLMIFVALTVISCGGGGGGSSSGGSSSGGSTSTDTTAPVTTSSPAGGTFTAGVSVSLTASEAATIYYTRDGSTPVVGGATTVSGASPITGIQIQQGTSVRLQFFAVDSAGNQEALKSETYSIASSGSSVDTTAPVTTASPVGGTFNAALGVTLTANEIATIYYSRDDSTPAVGGATTVSGTSPIAGIQIQPGLAITLKYFAVDSAGNRETLKSQTYSIVPVTTATPLGSNNTIVTLTASEPATIYYTTNGSDPTNSPSNGPSPIQNIQITISTILRFFAIDDAGIWEATIKSYSP